MHQDAVGKVRLGTVANHSKMYPNGVFVRWDGEAQPYLIETDAIYPEGHQPAPMPSCICLLPLNLRTLPILRDGKPEVMDLDGRRRANRAARGDPVNDHPSPIPDPWEGRKP